MGILVILHRFLAGSWFPTTSSTTFVFQNLILMIVLGSTLIEAKFTKPADALVNSSMVLMTLISMRGPTAFVAWNANFLYAAIVFALSLLSIMVGREDENRKTNTNRIARSSYAISTFFGRSHLIFSITFLLALFSFYSSQQRDFLVLLCFWGFIVVAQPIGLLTLIQRFFASLRTEALSECGKIISVTLPGFLQYEPYRDFQAKTGDFVALKPSVVKVLVVTHSYSFNEKAVTQAVVVASIPETEWGGDPLHSGKIYCVGTADDLKKALREGQLVLKSTVGSPLFTLRSF